MRREKKEPRLVYKGYNIFIEQDNDPESPREWDNLGTMVCYHKRYNLGDKKPCGLESPDYFADWYKEEKDQIADLIYLYLYDHSSLYLYCQEDRVQYLQHEAWDSGRVGFIFVMKEDVRKEWGVKRISKRIRKIVHDNLLSEVKVYSTYLAGGVVGWIVGDDDDDHIESVWGYYDTDYAVQEAKDCIDGYMQKKDEAAWSKVPVQCDAVSD
jgi:hypothetical protein